MRSRKRFNITTITCATLSALNYQKIPKLDRDLEVENVDVMKGLEDAAEIRTNTVECLVRPLIIQFMMTFVNPEVTTNPVTHKIVVVTVQAVAVLIMEVVEAAGWIIPMLDVQSSPTAIWMHR